MWKMNRLVLIRLLMIVSELVLMVFVGQWLHGQYVKERNRIDRECSRRFYEAEMVVVDSMLLNNVLNPLLGDSSYRRITMSIMMGSQDGGPIDWQQNRQETQPIYDSCKRVFAFMQTEENLLLKGVKLVVQQLEDSLLLSGRFMQRSALMKDTALLKSVFAAGLREMDPTVEIRWETLAVTGDSGATNPDRFTYMFPTHGYTLIARVNRPVLLVFGEIIPSVVFGLILLLLTGASFAITFRTLKKQIRLNAMRSGFVSNVTHELKTPVSTVKVALEALKRFDMKRDPYTTAEYLEMASREMERLDLLINQVLNASLHEHGSLVMHREPVDLADLIRETVTLFEPHLAGKEATVHRDAVAGPCRAMVDPLHLQGVLINLLDNSLKYGGPHPQITLRLSCTSSGKTICFSNNGPPIPREYLTRIFEKFFRIPSGDRHDTKGYGLGLSYAAMVMQLHGGSITAENNPGGGISFILQFPDDHS